jgi:predicted dehydrogenase
LGATWAASRLASASKSAAASDKVVIGIVGLGGRGNFLARLFGARPDVDIAYACDVHPARLERGMRTIEKATGKKAKPVDDFRRVLDDREVDAVVVATPHHWHALATILACQAGKDVYVEKPASHNYWEGPQMVEAARKYKRVVQVGMQNRSSSYGKSAREYVESGKLGDISLVRVYNMFPRRKFERASEGSSPASVKWDIWLGPAPERAYSETWFRDWLYFWDFSGGLLCDDAVHQLDLTRMVIGKGLPRSVHHAGGNLAFKDGVEPPDTSIVSCQYDNMTLMIEQTWWAPYMQKTPESIRQSDTLYAEWYPFDGTKVEIYGINGLMLLERQGGGWQAFDRDGQKVAQDKQTHAKMQAAHAENFVNCIRSRQRPNADIEEGHISAAICHIANISYRLGNRKLEFDSNTGTFVNDPEADRQLKRSYRSPWVVPERV